MKHTCHAKRCEVAVPPAMFMCKRHWFMLSKPLRDRIWATYRRGQDVDKKPSREYLDAADEAIDFIAGKEMWKLAAAAKAIGKQGGW